MKCKYAKITAEINKETGEADVNLEYDDKASLTAVTAATLHNVLKCSNINLKTFIEVYKTEYPED